MINKLNSFPIGVGMLLLATAFIANGQSQQKAISGKLTYTSEEPQQSKPEIGPLESILQLKTNTSNWDFSTINTSKFAKELNEPDYQPLKIPLHTVTTLTRQAMYVPPATKKINGTPYTRTGSYTLSEAGKGTLKLAGVTYTSLSRTTLEESYELVTTESELPLKQHIITNSWYAAGSEILVLQLVQLIRSVGHLTETKTVLLQPAKTNALPGNTTLTTSIDFLITPNPALNSTFVSYTLPASFRVKLNLQSIDGKYNELLINNSQAAGNYSIPVNTEQLANGMYFITLELDGYTSVKKLIINK